MGLDLVSQMREREHPWRHDHEADEVEGVVEPRAEHRRGDQVEERERLDVLVVLRGAPMEELGDLQPRGELQTERQDRGAHHPAGDLKREQRDDQRVPQRVVAGPRPGPGSDEGAHHEPHEERPDDARPELRAEREGAETEGRQAERDDLVEPTEPHVVTFSAVRTWTTVLPAVAVGQGGASRAGIDSKSAR